MKNFFSNDEKKLAIKISIASFVILLSILSLIIGTSYVYTSHRIMKELYTESQMIIDIPELNPFIINNRIDSTIRGRETKRKGPRDIVIINESGEIIKNDFLEINEKDIISLISIKKGEIVKLNFDGHSYLVGGNKLNRNTVLFFRDLTDLRNFHTTLLIIALVGSTIGLLVIFLLARYLARITIEPIREQSRELEAYSHNVAHELRTPLSVMRSNLELLRIKPESRFIESTDEEISSMERIIDSLLFLAKPTESFEKNPLNITKKTGEIIERYKGQSEIQYTHEKRHTQVQINEELYNRIICNLIENAIKYKSEGDIQIHISKNNIQISNQIDSIFNEDELKNITKVFYQGDQSRSSSGYGLGLALVQKIIDISGWKMQISTKNKEFVVEISF